MFKISHFHHRAGAGMNARPVLFCCIAWLSTTAIALGDDSQQLIETLKPGTQVRVTSRMNGVAQLSLPAEKDKKAGESLTKTAESRIEYDERILDADADGSPTRVLRIYRGIEFRKDIGKQQFRNTIRNGVRRLVVVRDKHLKMPFSPDGPMLISEIDLVRTDVFTPSLRGLLPANAVKPGEIWKANELAVRELTDVPLESGMLECKFEELTQLAGRSVASVRLSGAVRGVGEDGPVRHEINGRFYFDLESRHISYLSFQGKQVFLDKDDKPTGTIEGTFVLTRSMTRTADLDEAAIRQLKVEPDDENTQLLYDNEDLGLKFVYPRRWRVGDIQGRQMMIDADNGNGILLTLEPLKSVPTAAQFEKESQQFIRDQQGRVLGTQPARRIQAAPREVERFTIEAEMKNQRLVLDYFVLRQKDSGATISARLNVADFTTLRPEVERIVRSIELGK